MVRFESWHSDTTTELERAAQQKKCGCQQHKTRFDVDAAGDERLFASSFFFGLNEWLCSFAQFPSILETTTSSGINKLTRISWDDSTVHIPSPHGSSSSSFAHAHESRESSLGYPRRGRDHSKTRTNEPQLPPAEAQRNKKPDRLLCTVVH